MEKRPCSSTSRKPDRYRRKELEKLARIHKIPLKKGKKNKTITELCNELFDIMSVNANVAKKKTLGNSHVLLIELPNEVLTIILSHLDYERLIKFKQLNKYFYSLVNQEMPLNKQVFLYLKRGVDSHYTSMFRTYRTDVDYLVDPHSFKNHHKLSNKKREIFPLVRELTWLLYNPAYGGIHVNILPFSNDKMENAIIDMTSNFPSNIKQILAWNITAIDSKEVNRYDYDYVSNYILESRDILIIGLTTNNVYFFAAIIANDELEGTCDQCYFVEKIIEIRIVISHDLDDLIKYGLSDHLRTMLV